MLNYHLCLRLVQTGVGRGAARQGILAEGAAAHCRVEAQCIGPGAVADHRAAIRAQVDVLEHLDLDV